METIYIIVLFVLTIVFSALWLKEKYGSEDLRTRVGRIERMLSSIDGRVSRLSGDSSAEQGDGPVTREAVEDALRYHHLTVEAFDPDEPAMARFSYRDIRYRINTERLPYLFMEVGFSIDPEEDDIDFLMQVAQDITYGMYIVKVMVSPKEKYFVYQVDFIADTYRSLRDNLRNYLDLLLDARRQFGEKYRRRLDEQKQAASDALQNTLLAAQTDAAGHVLPS